MAAKKTPEQKKEATSGRGKFSYFVMACALIAAGGWYWNSRTAVPTAQGAAQTVKSTLHLETFVLNLAGPDQRSYLRVGIDLGLGRELGKRENAPVAQARDTILSVLGQFRVEDLQDEKGKAKLKADVLRALQEKIPELGVEEVYFTEFLIQR
ncbi:MAG: flagellar basal body-associated FliL family protein [Candidatus Sulfotelmatobacter sp.]